MIVLLLYIVLFYFTIKVFILQEQLQKPFVTFFTKRKKNRISRTHHVFGAVLFI